MPEYTDLSCHSLATAKATEAYLDEELYSIEATERPEINAYVHLTTLRIEYGNDVSNGERREWDMQLKGYRDGYEAGIDSERQKIKK